MRSAFAGSCAACALMTVILHATCSGRVAVAWVSKRGCVRPSRCCRPSGALLRAIPIQPLLQLNTSTLAFLRSLTALCSTGLKLQHKLYGTRGYTRVIVAGHTNLNDFNVSPACGKCCNVRRRAPRHHPWCPSRPCRSCPRREPSPNRPVWYRPCASSLI